MRSFPVCLIVLVALGPSAFVPSAGAQERRGEDEAEVLATVEAALAAISAEDMVAFTDLMVEEAIMFRVVEREAGTRYFVRTRAGERAQVLGDDIVERGFDAEVHVAGALAVVWLPYDFYIDGEWSHCGVDAFTLVRVQGAWRIASIAWSVQQPPDCRPHPGGPPGG